MEPKTLEQVIRDNIILPPYPSSRGWYHVLCKVCNDHGRKGDRGGFKFDDGTVAYNCFNCGHTASFLPDSDIAISHKMKTVLDAFGVPEEEWKAVEFNLLRNKDVRGSVQRESYTSHVSSLEPPSIPLPEHFYYLKDASPSDKWAAIARDYLVTERNVDPLSYPFMLSSVPTDQHMVKWVGRLIIPIYKDNRLIFYHGRDLTGRSQKKYESPPVPKNKILYGFDKLFVDIELPLYIVEGWFDANAIDGIAIFGNELTPEQICWLNKSKRKKVYIPDRFGDGHRAAEQALKCGWSISTPDIGNSIKDMSEAVQKYGKLYVMHAIAEGISDGFSASVRLGVYCDQKRRTKKNKKTPQGKG